jgi:hypothetical protein
MMTYIFMINSIGSTYPKVLVHAIPQWSEPKGCLEHLKPNLIDKCFLFDGY